jgi:hypothetical protein
MCVFFMTIFFNRVLSRVHCGYKDANVCIVCIERIHLIIFVFEGLQCFEV